MPAYQYQALDDSGKTRKGTLEAETQKAARAALRQRGLVPLEVQALQAGTQGSGLNRPLFAGKAFDRTTLAVWTRQLAGLVAAGLPVERALHALSEDSAPERQRQLVTALRTEVHAGSSLAKALQQHPREFSSIYIAVIAAGEHSGHLGMVLQRLADDLEAQQELSSKVMGAALYPMIVSLVAVAIVVFLLSYVVPQVAGVYAGSKRALPLLTTVMLSFSDLIRQWGWLLALLLATGALLVQQLRKRDAFRQRMDAWLLRLPMLGGLICQYNAARFASTLAMLADTIQLLQQTPGISPALLYLSDHGESLGENGMFLHAAPYAVAPDVQTHVPMVFWGSKDFYADRGLDAACLKTQAGKPHSHDNLFHSVLGAMNVKTALYQRDLDLFAGCKVG